MEVALGFLAVFLAIAVPLTVEAFRRPRFRLIAGEPSLDIRRNRKFVHVQVVNRPLTSRWFLANRWLMRNTATGCTAYVTFEDLKTGERPTLNEPAKWAGTPELLSLVPSGDGMAWIPDQTKVALSYVIDVPPGEAGQALALALKYGDEQSAYAYNARSYEGPELRFSPFELTGDEYQVTVRVEAGGIERSERFRMRNYGTSLDDFKVVADPAGAKRS